MNSKKMREYFEDWASRNGLDPSITPKYWEVWQAALLEIGEGPRSIRSVSDSEQFNLRPCRFCGSPAELLQRHRMHDVWDTFGSCTNDHDVDGKSCIFMLPDSPFFYLGRKQDAATYWNLIMGPRRNDDGEDIIDEIK